MSHGVRKDSWAATEALKVYNDTSKGREKDFSSLLCQN
jgi:hypothetical protein